MRDKRDGGGGGGGVALRSGAETIGKSRIEALTLVKAQRANLFNK